MHNREIEFPYTYLLPMRSDRPEFADFEELRAEIADINGLLYGSPLLSQVARIMGSGQGLDRASDRITVHRAGGGSIMAGVKAITFHDATTTPEDLEYNPKQGHGRISRRAAAEIIRFANRFRRNQEKTFEDGTFPGN